MSNSFLNGFVTAVLLILYFSEWFFQWKPPFWHNKPYGSRTATAIAIAKYGISFAAFVLPFLQVTKFAAIALTGIGFIKETGYYFKLKDIKKKGGYKI